MTNRQAHKLNSMPVTNSSTDTPTPPPSVKKHTTLSRLFHKPHHQQSFVDTSLNSEMKRKPSYQSDPNLLADNEDKSASKKGKGWKWPFPKNRNNKELPEQIVEGIQPISIHNKNSYFPKSVILAIILIVLLSRVCVLCL